MARASRSVDLTQVTEWNDGTAARKDDFLAAEEPLEIRIGENPLSVTMRTPGHDVELAAGFLFTEGLVQRREQIVALENVTSDDDGKRGNVVRAELSSEALPDFDKLRRHFFAASSCGICGKASIDAVRSRLLRTPNPDFRVAPKLLVSLPEALRSAQDVFERTGGLHAAALFDAGGKLLIVREDIGRHNAVDKVIGWALLNRPHSAERLRVAGQRARGIRNYSEGHRRWDSGGRVGVGAFESCRSACTRASPDAHRIPARQPIRGLRWRRSSGEELSANDGRKKEVQLIIPCAGSLQSSREARQ